MSLPVIDGWEASRMLKSLPEASEIPIIALTAHAMAADRDRALAAGCDDFHAKPVDLAQLLDQMERLLLRFAKMTLLSGGCETSSRARRRASRG
jgi:CheY-like chemotaxis protein